MKGLFCASLLPLLASASPIFIDTIHKDAAPVLSSSNSKTIPNSYLVVFKKDVSANAAAAHHDWVQDLHVKTEDTKMELRKRSQFPLMDSVFEGLKHTFHIPGSLIGYSGHFDDEVIEQVRRHPDVRLLSHPGLTRHHSTSTISSFVRMIELY